jgi:O-acetyl-ADP-ribose deacetylase (regulator of RNase III)
MNKTIRRLGLGSGKLLKIIIGNITEEDVDAIVNAANKYLQHGGGVAGEISLKGGRQIQLESDEWIEKFGPVEHDTPAYTGGGNLPSRYVIHAVGPVWGEGKEDKKLGEAISGSLKLGDQLQIKTIAFPAISTGIFGFPKERAAEIILQQFAAYFDEFPDSGLEEVRLTLFDQESLVVFTRAAERLFI